MNKQEIDMVEEALCMNAYIADNYFIYYFPEMETIFLYYTMSEIIITFSEPWYNEPIITNTAFDEAVNNYVKELIRMIKVTDNKEIKETVLSGLKRNKEKYGKRYCPCSLERTDDTVCMCKEFREMDKGICHCQLYIKE